MTCQSQSNNNQHVPHLLQSLAVVGQEKQQLACSSVLWLLLRYRRWNLVLSLTC